MSPELIMTFGGHTPNEDDINRVNKYNVTDNSWSQGPNMQQSRSYAMCGVVKDPGTGEPVQVVVAGGNNNNAGHLNKVEVLDLKTPGASWRWASK